MGQARPQAAPSVFGRYETLFRIASGGMAEVYAARVRGEAGFQKLVALKRMLPHLTDDDRFVTMFMDEGRLAANISSPNVVSTLDLGRADDGSLYLVMELVLGTTLSGLLRNAARDSISVPIDVAVELLAQAAQGLHDAHEARTPMGAPLHIVHRDVSPQNILVGTDGRVRITDFGVARAILRRTKTSTGEFKGKLSYFSPEQCADKDIDRRSDVFSLGVVAWETFTTRRLFHAENPLAVLERVTRMPIPPAHTVNPAVPPAISAVVAKALERERTARYASAAELGQALRAAARDAGAGFGEPTKVALLVRQLCGDAVERLERQLRESLASPSPEVLPPLDDAKTEISSGIVFRSEDGTVMPATPPANAMISSTGASFVGPLDMAPAARAERPPSKWPFVVAILVAAIGLAVGAVVGVMAVTSDAPPPAPTEVQVLPPEGSSAPPMPLPPAGAAAVEEPPPATPAPQEARDAPGPAPSPPPRARHAPRRGRHAPLPVPTPQPLGPPPASNAPAGRGSQTRTLPSVDDFDRDVGQR